MRQARSLSGILSDNTSGAQAITQNVTRLILERCLLRRSAPENLKAAILKIAGSVLEAHPAMVSLFHLFNRLLFCLDQQPEKPAVELAAHIDKFERGLEVRNRKIAAAVGRLIEKDALVLTHSASRTVEDALCRCRRRGTRFGVVCTESRPAREGVVLARALARRGISTTLVADALAFSILRGGLEQGRKPALVLVGADAVSPRGVINKAGTLGLALAARAWSVPFYVLAGSEKFAPHGYPVETAIRDKPAGEILASAPKRLRVVNRYFDVTPLRYVTAVVSEQGMLRPGRMPGRLFDARIHRELLKLLKP